MRKFITMSSLLVGLGLSVASFFLAMPLGGKASMQFSPLLFILGVILMILSAVIYEVFPETDQRAE